MNDTETKIIHAGTPQSIKMSDKPIANLFLIDLLIGNHKIPFVFDTGASITVMCESIGHIVGAISLDEPIVGGGNANTRISASKSLVDLIQIGNSKIKKVPIVVVPDDYLDFGSDENGNEMKVKGFLGWDIIQHFKWTIDARNRVFVVEQPIESKDRGNLFWDNMPIVTAKYENQLIYFGFDTGNTETMFSKNFIPYLKTMQDKVDRITGVDGVVEEKVFVANNTELVIGDRIIKLNGSSVLSRDIFPTKKYNVMGLLAADIIQNSKCIIDYLNHSFEVI